MREREYCLYNQEKNNQSQFIQTDIWMWNVC